MLTQEYRCPYCGSTDHLEVCDYPFDSTGSKYRAWCDKCENAFELYEPETEYEEYP